ncbi:GNAT family N-acetyltransferase [Roseovarius tibetensis]|uniref:GNAT family N-acetyltransferase n=1 Tax=Roseovarius tibetensis TaxID=2685897 RepID=UPI003D7FC131
MRARLWHLPRIAAILWAFTRATPWLPKVRSPLDDLRALGWVTARGWVRVMRDTAGVSGFIVCDGTRVHALYVAPDRRGRGVGRALLSEAKTRSDMLDLWVLSANIPARAFYLGQGFTEVVQGQGAGNDEGLPDILMIWQDARRTA